MCVGVVVQSVAGVNDAIGWHLCASGLICGRRKARYVCLVPWIKEATVNTRLSALLGALWEYQVTTRTDVCFSKSGRFHHLKFLSSQSRDWYIRRTKCWVSDRLLVCDLLVRIISYLYRNGTGSK